MAIQTVFDLEQPATDIAGFIDQRIAENKKVLWLVAGGSSVKLAAAAANLIKPTAGRLVITLSDERFGPVGYNDSNWQQLLEAGFIAEGAKLLPVLEQGLDLNQTTAKFAANLQTEFEDNEVKIGLFGIGVDGHIAGILPHSQATLSDDWATSYEAPPYSRITMTFRAIRQLDLAWLYFEDPAKLPAIEKLDENPPLDEEPAAILKRLPKIIVYYKHK